MASRRSPSPDNPAPQSIPLQNLSRPPDEVASHSRQNSRNTNASLFGIGHGRTPSILARRQYRPLSTDSPLDNINGSTPTDTVHHLGSPEDVSAFANAGIGISIEGPSTSHATPGFRAEDFIGRPNDLYTTSSPQEDDDLTPLRRKSNRQSAMKDGSASGAGQRHDRKSKRSSVQFMEPPIANNRSPRGS